MNFEPVPSSYYRRSAASDAGLANFMRTTYAWMAGGLGVTGLMAWLVAHTPAVQQLVFGNSLLLFGLVIAELALVFTFSRKVASLPTSTAAALFLGYSLLNGITLSAIFLVYAQATLTQAFLISGGSFAALSMYGAVTKRDLSPVGNFMGIGLIGLLLASVVNMFLHSPAVEWISSYVGVMIFAGLTAYDNQRLKQLYAVTGGAGNLALQGALTLYLDFVNLFLFMLRIVSDRR